jgi:hypothetical protein
MASVVVAVVEMVLYYNKVIAAGDASECSDELDVSLSEVEEERP